MRDARAIFAMAWNAKGAPVADRESQIWKERERFYMVRLQVAAAGPASDASEIVALEYGAAPRLIFIAFPDCNAEWSDAAAPIVVSATAPPVCELGRVESPESLYVRQPVLSQPSPLLW